MELKDWPVSGEFSCTELHQINVMQSRKINKRAEKYIFFVPFRLKTIKYLPFPLSLELCFLARSRQYNSSTGHYHT